MATSTRTIDERKLVTPGNPEEAYPIPKDAQFTGENDEPVDFIEAADLKKIGDALIKKRMDLRHLDDVRVDYRWKLAGGQAGGKVHLGKCIKASGLVAHYSGATFIIWLAADHGRALKLTRWQVEALVYHELCHADFVTADDGEVTHKTKGHDFEGFRSEVDHYGLWQADLQAAARSIQLRLVELSDGDDDTQGDES